MNPLHPLTIPTYRQLFAAMVLTIFAQGAWALYLTMQTLDPVSYTHLTLPTIYSV